MNQNTSRYRDYSSYLFSIFQERIQKITINAGFTCPNRDGTLGVGGCAFCNNEAFNPDFANSKNSISKQIEDGIGFFSRKYQNQHYLAYFQTYTNTYGPLENLKRLYETALNDNRIVGLVIGTRPDCVSPELLDYLSDLAKKYYVMVEYGVESTDDATLLRINRGHDYAKSVWAIEETHKRAIHTSAHLILGLPGENEEIILKHASKISELPINTLKLHQLQIIKNTSLYNDFQRNKNSVTTYELNDYLELLCKFIVRVRPDITLERFVSQSPAELLISPHWGVKNFEFAAKLDKMLKLKNLYQGELWAP